jgi:hypothetical protein
MSEEYPFAPISHEPRMQEIADALVANGLANSSDQVGRNYMYHLLGLMVAVSNKSNPTSFQKT